jgi:hypothetical protein
MQSSENPSGADTQQERSSLEQWIVGFVDGEGCFSVPIFRNDTCKSGWQVQPQFSVVQGARSVEVLHELKSFFGCGQVGRNARHDNHREDMYRFTVRSIGHLSDHIIPFFEANPLRTAKRNDFKAFATVVRSMQDRHHLTMAGLADIARLAESMNRRQQSRFLKSSETIRQPSSFDDEEEDMVLAT